MVGWLVGLLFGWLVGELVGWCADWLCGWLVGGLVDWLVGGSRVGLSWFVGLFLGGRVFGLFGPLEILLRTGVGFVDMWWSVCLFVCDGLIWLLVGWVMGLLVWSLLS